MEQEDFSQKEKDPLGHFGEFPCSNSSSLLSTLPLASPGSVHIDRGLCAPHLAGS